MRRFFVADLNAQGELGAVAEYRYELLEQIPGASALIAHCAANIWRSPEEFDTDLPGASGSMTLRWRASAATAGIATVRHGDDLVSVSLFASGLDDAADQITFEALQRHLLRQLQDTKYEPAFALVNLTQRPLVATLNFAPPADSPDQMTAALVDRCFAAAYFRRHGLA